ncbi:MAG: sugar ABC transporter substrate-binding protein [Lachnospiraceae bacterium]|jgi:ribose transport system substrate-binding protein|nr:sugar ABC transporter substrate-binding protein [Lachnospiraceae bacterium]
MKKRNAIVAMALAGAMAVGLAACGGTSASSGSAAADEAASESSTAAASSSTQEETGTEAETVTSSSAGADQSVTASSGKEVTKANGDYNMAVVLKTTASEYWTYVIAGIRDAEKDLGNVKVEIQGASGDTAFDEQLNIVETVVNSGKYDAVAVAPLQADAVNKIAEGTDIPMLAIDTNYDKALSFIGTAHEDAAYQGGKYVAEKVGKGAKVAILGNVQGEATSESRISGYKKAMEEAGCEIVSTQYTDGLGDKAVTTMDGILQTYPDLDAVLCCNDDTALGVSRSIQSAGRQGDGIIVCGFDGISSGVKAVIDGSISCTVAQDPYNMGYQCVMSMVDVLNGNTIDKFIDTGCKVITPDNAKDYLSKLDSYTAEN